MTSKTSTAFSVPLESPIRMAALERAQLLDQPPDEAFDRATRMATRHLGTPVGLASIVDDHRQFFKSSIGLPEPWNTARETPLTHSFCQHVVMRQEPLVVQDARQHELVRDNLAIRDLDVIAYAGVPIRDGDGNVLGSLCAIDGTPRTWSDDDVAMLADIASTLRQELRLRRALEAAERLEQNRTEMLAILAHDLRGPLTVVLGLAATIDQRADDLPKDKVISLLGSVKRSAQQAVDLVEQLLTLEGTLPAPTPEQVDLRAEIRALADSHDALGERVVANDGPEVWATVDRRMVHQILANLVGNATKHAGDAATVTVDVQAEPGAVILSVGDDGVGMSPEDLAKMFERGRKGTNSRGHGLGLHIVRRFVDALDGEISAIGQVGVGTRFDVRLPA